MTIPINPYIAGNPVGGSDAFIGRADVLREVLRTLRSPNENALLLYGQRRIGKTSVLQELRQRLPQEGPYQPVYFDLQDQASLPIGQLLQELASRINQDLQLKLLPLDQDNAEDTFQTQFLPQVLRRLPEDSSVVLLLDEFDVLDSPAQGQASAAFFPYLRTLLTANSQRLQFIFVIGRRPDDLTTLTTSVFKATRAYPVSLLSSADTTNLVQLAARNESLTWPDTAVAQVYALTGGHPFLSQQLCQELWEQLYHEDPDNVPVVDATQVDAAVPATLSGARQALEWLWDGLNPAERVVAAALAEAGPSAITQTELEQRLQDSGVRILIGELQHAPRVLQDWDLIVATEGGFRFRMELLRRWIAERKPLSRVQDEIDRIQPLADNLFQAAYGFYGGSQLEQAIPLLKQAIGLNPNHLKANQLLVEIFLAQGQLEEARQLLETLYQYQPAVAKPRLIQTWLLQAEAEREEEARLALYEQILQVDENQPEAAQKYRLIWTNRAETALADDDLETALAAFKKAGLLKKVIKIEIQIKERQFERDVQELTQLEQAQKYKEAFNLAQMMHQHYREYADILPDLQLLAQKIRLDEYYQQALEAFLHQDRDIAKVLFAAVIQIEPDYRDAIAYLLLVVKDIDVFSLQKALRRLKDRITFLSGLVILSILLIFILIVGTITSN